MARFNPTHKIEAELTGEGFEVVVQSIDNHSEYRCKANSLAEGVRKARNYVQPDEEGSRFLGRVYAFFA